MRKVRVAILVVLNLMLLSMEFSYIHRFLSQVKFKVELLRFYRVAFPVDVDADGKKELLVISDYPIINGREECTIFKPFIKNSIGEFFGEFLFPKGFMYIGSLKKNSHILYRFVGKKKDKIVEIVSTNQGKIVSERQFETPKDFDEFYPFSPRELVDLDEDGEKELIGTFSVTYGPYPRGLIAYDLKTGKLLWEYKLGPIPRFPLLVEDVNNDGRKEIIFGTGAVNNGVEYNGMPDKESYLISLSWDGKENWRRLLGKWYTTIFPVLGDINQDGKLEIIATKEVHRTREKENGEIWIFDTDGNILKEKSENVSFSPPQLIKWNGRNFIYVGDSMGRIRILDENLDVKAQINLGKPATVIEGGRNWPFVLASTSDRFYFLSKNLKKILFSFEYKEKIKYIGLGLYASPPKIFDFSENGNIKAIISADYIYTFRYTPTSYLSFLKAILSGPSLIYIILLFGVNLLFILSISIKSLSSCENYHKEIEEALQEMAHKLKTPMTILIWSLEKLKKELEKGKFESQILDSIISEVENLDAGVKNIVRLASLRELKKDVVDLSQLLLKLAYKYKETCPSHIEFKFDIESNVFIYGNKEALEEIMVNLIENSIEAIEKEGKIYLSLYTKMSLFSRGKEAIIEVTDTGKGIKQENLKEIFKPHFSTKKSMGIGLTIAKRVIDLHDGEIRVQSKEGLGTKFIVILPALEVKDEGKKDTYSRQ